MVARFSQGKLASTRHKALLDTTMARHSSPRFLLWVDAVGGFLICQGERVVLGHAVPDSRVDVPIQADLKRRHADVLRDGEGYLLLTEEDARVDGRPVRGAALLRDGCLIELGAAVRLRFHRPHPLSATARLQLVSHHRTLPAVDGVLLMAESCLLGPHRHCHVLARDWRQDLLLFRGADGLRCRTEGTLEIDGVAYRGEGPVTPNSRIGGDDFSLHLEEI